MAAERLQKLLAQAGHGSRRACEEFILAGRVRVNGQTAALGQKADPAVDAITLDGRALAVPEQKTYIALYKPRGVISASEDRERRTVRDLIPEAGHLYPVGRLDWDSEGLILMTNDGDLTFRLTHPRFGHEKEYRVLIARQPDQQQLLTWRRGVVLEDGYKTAPAQVWVEARAGKGAWLRVVMGEGRKRQIREIGELIGLPVVRIIRVRIGTLLLGGLKPGEWRHLGRDEVADLSSDRPARAATSKARPRARPARSPRERSRPAPAAKKPRARKAK